MKFKICKNKEAYIDRKGNSIAGYHIEFKNKLGFWCKYKRIPDWSLVPGTPFVVTYISRKGAERVMTKLQNGTKCNEGVSIVMVMDKGKKKGLKIGFGLVGAIMFSAFVNTFANTWVAFAYFSILITLTVIYVIKKA